MEDSSDLNKLYKTNPYDHLLGTFHHRKNKTFISKTVKKQRSNIKDKETSASKQNEKAFLRNTVSRFGSVISSTHQNEDTEEIIINANYEQQSKKRIVLSRNISIKKSPYLTNSIDLKKMFKLLNPVYGPSESLKLQIKKHNEFHIKNAENIILQKTDSFEKRMNIYLQRLSLGADTKIFIMNSKDGHIRKALLDRKWVEVNDTTSVFFHLKWVYMDNPLDYHKLQSGQFYNHFQNNQELTNKNYLQKNIKKHSIPQRPNFPLSYDLEVNQDFVQFTDQFFKFQAIRIFDKIIQIIKSNDQLKFKRICQNKMHFTNLNLRKRNVNIDKLSESRSKQYKKHECTYKKYANILVKTSRNHRNEQRQCNKISQNQRLIKKLKQRSTILQASCSKRQQQLIESIYKLMCYLIQSEMREVRYSCFEWSSKACIQQMNILRTIQLQINYNHGNHNHGNHNHGNYNHGNHGNSQQAHHQTSLREIIKERFSDFYIAEMVKLWRHLQQKHGVNYGMKNMWIIKPTGVSRGSGITITNDFLKITQNKYGKIVQKYIESPLILHCRRKFDIRQWVLVKNFTNLEVYIFKKCYARFSSTTYTNQHYQDLQTHLTNYSTNKEHFAKINKTANNFHTHQSHSVMSELELQKQVGTIRWKSIKQQVYANIFKTLKCCQPSIQNNESSFEVFGFDILLDQDYLPWLLEVNLSPACEARQFLDEDLFEMADGIGEMLEGNEVKHWVEINENDVRLFEAQQQKKQKQTKAANMIQCYWRKKMMESKYCQPGQIK